MPTRGPTSVAAADRVLHVLAVLAQGAASAAMLQDVTGFGKAEIRAAVYRLMMRETVESVAPNWKVHQRSVVYQLVEGR